MGLQSKLMLMAMAILAVTSLTEAQNNIPSCASKLVQCSNFINSKTQPDATCCNAIKDAVANELPCLCSLFNSGVLSSFNISVTEALRITKECNVPGDLSNCNGTAAPPPSTSMQPPPGNNDNGATVRLAWTGITILLFFWAASAIFYLD
ncbi:Lipid transfer protein [Melia azedarach]|uniref:Lipid transfer protein n=1 Tax=Melia azedarach TaxID=155640 RepID=A0ACC1XN53_MELAZ|nr:Lipid transfer protein [Melia azedarach]